MAKGYVEQRNGGYYVSGTRVSLDSVVYAFMRGESPEEIADSFPALTLEQVYGAIAFYLAHREEIDAYLQSGQAEFERLREEACRAHPLLFAKIEAAHKLRDILPRGARFGVPPQASACGERDTAS